VPFTPHSLRPTPSLFFEPMTISIIIVNWNVKNLLANCLHSIYRSNIDSPPEVIVVDNASTDGSAEMVRVDFPQVKLIVSAENLGFAAGNNLAAAHAIGETFFLLNPDTQLHPDALFHLRDYLAAHPQVGVVAPQLRWPDGAVQSSRRRFPSPASMFWESTLLEQWFPRNRVAQRYKFSDVPPTATIRVDWAVGAALFLRRAVWETVGRLDETFFLYFEETDWCRRVADAGWELHYLPAAKVVHFEGQSSRQVVSARTVRFQRSKIRYAEKWFGTGWAWVIRQFLRLTTGIQWATEAAKWALGHKRSLRRERMSAYRKLLKLL